jgi:PKD repeat protein
MNMPCKRACGNDSQRVYALNEVIKMRKVKAVLLMLTTVAAGTFATAQRAQQPPSRALVPVQMEQLAVNQTIDQTIFRMDAEKLPEERTDSGIQYDVRLGMLVFRDVEVFRNTLERLDDQVTHFQYDNGNTAQLLAALATSNGKPQAVDNSARDGDKTATNLYKKLLASYPLSEEVLIAVLRSDLSATNKAVLVERNIDFGEDVASVLESIKLPSLLKREISLKRFKQVPFQPVLDEFETQFPGFFSLRRATDAAELRFLLSGGNPAARANPSNKNSLDRLLSTLLNSRTEVKIGRAIYLYLPHREVTISNGDTSVLKYIRTNGNVPRINAPVSEPKNGLPIAVAPSPVDPNIVVAPTDRENGCGDVAIDTDDHVSGRLAFHSNIKGKGVLHYWNFGDGYVSYKENPTHAYSDSAIHTVTLTVFNSLGLRCGSTNSPQTGTGNGNGTGGASCTLPASIVVQGGSDLMIGCVVNVLGGFTAPLSINWDFGDSGFSVSNPTNHIYQVAGHYQVTVTITDAAGCRYTNQVLVTVSNPIPPFPQCCTKYDKKKDSTLISGGNHLFKHTLKTNDSWGITPEVYANVTTYTKTAGIWFWSYNTSGVNVSGNVFENDPQTNTCGRSFAVSKVQTGKYVFNTIRIKIPWTPIYTEFQSVTSDGSAFGDNDHIAISDCQ